MPVSWQQKNLSNLVGEQSATTFSISQPLYYLEEKKILAIRIGISEK